MRSNRSLHNVPDVTEATPDGCILWFASRLRSVPIIRVRPTYLASRAARVTTLEDIPHQPRVISRRSKGRRVLSPDRDLGSTGSTRCAAVSAIRRAPHDEQTTRPLQENVTTQSSPQASQGETIRVSIFSLSSSAILSSHEACVPSSDPTDSDGSCFWLALASAIHVQFVEDEVTQSRLAPLPGAEFDRPGARGAIPPSRSW